MSTTITLVADLWAHVGPGLLLAFALPFFLVLGGLILLHGARRVRARARGAEESA